MSRNVPTEAEEAGTARNFLAKSANIGNVLS